MGFPGFPHGEKNSPVAPKVHHVARVVCRGGGQAWTRLAAGEREGLPVCGALRGQACRVVEFRPCPWKNPDLFQWEFTLENPKIFFAMEMMI